MTGRPGPSEAAPYYFRYCFRPRRSLREQAAERFCYEGRSSPLLAGPAAVAGSCYNASHS